MIGKDWPLLACEDAAHTCDSLALLSLNSFNDEKQ